MIVFQSSTTVLRPYPFGTSENSPAIYGWVHRPLKTQSPEGTTEILFHLANPKNRGTGFIACREFILSILSESLCLGASVAGKKPNLPNEPIFPWGSWCFKRFHSKCFKAIQILS